MQTNYPDTKPWLYRKEARFTRGVVYLRAVEAGNKLPDYEPLGRFMPKSYGVFNEAKTNLPGRPSLNQRIIVEPIALINLGAHGFNGAVHETVVFQDPGQLAATIAFFHAGLKDFIV